MESEFELLPGVTVKTAYVEPSFTGPWPVTAKVGVLESLTVMVKVVVERSPSLSSMV